MKPFTELTFTNVEDLRQKNSRVKCLPISSKPSADADLPVPY